MTSLLANAFGGVVRARNAMYDRGWIKIDRAARPVISIGNIAVGGIGKTPFCILLANKLTARGEKVAVLSRGYGARARIDEPQVVTATSRAEDVGDEPVLIAQKTQAIVVVCPKRIEAARLAIEEHGASLLLLDDGFQHRRLARDLDIVLLDALDPFTGGLMPRGLLREPPDALERAHLIALVGKTEAPPPQLPDRPLLRIEVIADRDLRGQKVALLAAIGRPDRFVATVEQLGAEVVWTRFFRDHAFYEAAPLLAEARAHGATLILTTEKDHARHAHAGVEPLPIAHRITHGEAELDRLIESALQK